MNDMIEEATYRLYAEFCRSPQPTNWILSAWANVNRQGDFNEMHTHPGATWSGAYYVDRGESNPDTEGTTIHLYDPNPARANVFFTELSTSNLTAQVGFLGSGRVGLATPSFRFSVNSP